jgi:hypothetical protein
VLIELKIPSNPNVVLVVRFVIIKLLATPEFVDMEFVEILEAVSKPVLRVVVLRKGGKADKPAEIPVRPDPSPINFA